MSVTPTTTTLPKYQRVKRAIIRLIETGQYTAGMAFPSEHQLLERFDVSRPTLVRSLQELVNEGFLVRHQGKGTFVAERRGHVEQSASGRPIRGGGAGSVTVFISTTTASITGAGREVQHRVLRGVQDGLALGGCALTVRQASPDVIDPQTRTLIESRGPGMALMIEPAFNPALRAMLVERGWRVWSVNEPLDDGDCVYIDQEQAGYIATRFLLDEGRHRVALLNGVSTSYWGFAARARGYRRALEEAGVAFDPALSLEADHPIDSESGRMMMRSLIESGVELDAVVGASDPKAIGALSAAREMGRSVPDDVLMVSIDNTLAGQADPPLPAVAMPFEEMGYQAAVQAMTPRRLPAGHDKATLTRISLQPMLVER